jgi:hypothetical protein
VHATGEDFKFYEHLLDFLPIGSDHTGKELGRLVFKVLQQFQITKKLLSISTDSGSNNLTLADNIQEQLEEFYEVEKENYSIRFVSELLQGRRSLMRCCAHSTNTIVKALLDALRTADLQCELLDSDETDNTNFDVDREGFLVLGSDSQTVRASVNSPIAAIRELFKILKYSPKMRSLFDSESESGQKRYSVPLDVPTRWSSTYNMLEFAVKHERQIKAFMKKFLEKDYVGAETTCISYHLAISELREELDKKS